MAFENAEAKILGHERVEIDPDQLLEEAAQFKNQSNYSAAEQAYINAVNSAKGTPKAASVMRRARSGVCEVYQAWADACVKNGRYSEAEQVHLKEIRATSDVPSVKKQLRRLYYDWGEMLLEAGKYTAAEHILIKALAMDKAMGVDIIEEDGHIIDDLCRINYLYNTEEESNLAGRLLYLVKNFRVLEKAGIIILLTSGIFGISSPLLRPRKILCKRHSSTV